MTSTSSLPPTMQAWTYTAPGPPSTALTFTKTHPTPPSPGANEALIKITHCGFNAGVAFIMQLVPSFMHRTPAIPELDFSGTIISTGVSTAHPTLQPGAAIFGCCPPVLHSRYGSGTLAEYVVVPLSMVSPLPSSTSPLSACALGGCGCTAVQSMRRASLTRGQSVLINGGSGGLGSILVQVARATVGPTGRVVATCSAANLDFVQSLGADEVVDYTAHKSLGAHLSSAYANARFDAVIDTVGIQELYLFSPAYLREKGIFINAGGMLVSPIWSSFLAFFFMMLLNYVYPSFLPRGVNRRYAFLSGAANAHDLGEVKRLVEEGKLKVPIDSVWGMQDAWKGYERIESKRAKGKVVIEVGN